MKKFLCVKSVLCGVMLSAGMMVSAEEAEPLLSYGFETQMEADDSGIYPFTLFNDAMILATEDGNHVLVTGKSDGYLDLGAAVGSGVLSRLTGDYSISIDVRAGTGNTLDRFGWVWAFTHGTNTYLGLVNAAGNKDWYYEIKDGSAQSVRSRKGLTVNEWHTVTVVQQEGTCTYYLDGAVAGSQALTLQPSAFASTLTDNYLGRSPFAGDAYMRDALMDNFRIYDCALSAEQVASLHAERPVSAEVVMDVDHLLELVRKELYMAQTVRYLHNRLELPVSCSYGEVTWTYQPYAVSGTKAALEYKDGVFTVTERTDEAVVVGELQGTIAYDGKTYDLYEQPLQVTVAPDDEAYGYLYCHMPNLVPETGVGTLVSQVITYALGTEADRGLVFNELNRGSSIIEGIGSSLPWCRDAFMAKDKKRKCYYIVTTDLYGSRDGGTSMLENYSIGMFRSYDMINWTYNRFDLKQYLTAHPVTDIYDNSGTRLLTASKVSRVWAPQIIFIDGDPYLYYAVGNTDNGDCDHFYISKANEDFTGITSFRMLYGANQQDNVLDADINFLETDGLYHMSYRDYAGNGILDITTADLLNPQWSVPVSSFQDGSGYEASSVFRRINDDVWNVGNVNYGNNVGYHFHTADALLRNLQPAPNMSGRLSPQHGSFVYVNETEYRLVQVWSDLKALLSDGKQLTGRGGSSRLQEIMDRTNKDITTDKGEATDLPALLAGLEQDFTELRARLRLETVLLRAGEANFSESETRKGVLDRMYNQGRLAVAVEGAETAAGTNDAVQWERAAGNLEDALAVYFTSLQTDAEPIGLSNGDFANGTSGWTLNGNAGSSAGVAEFFALRAANYSVSIHQTLNKLSEGYYLVKCQAFERNGENDHTGRDCREGVEQINYEFFAGEASVPVQSLYALPYEGNGSLHGFANTMSAANSMFAESSENYANYLVVYVEEGERLPVGIRRALSTVHSSDWCCFDNFMVWKMDVPTSIIGIPNTEESLVPVYDMGGVKRGSTDVKGQLPQELKDGLYIVKGHKVLKNK